MEESEWYSQALASVFNHYGLGSVGYGERPVKCPVHDDAHASASANGSKGLWNCHACGASGNAIHIVASREDISYADAKKFIENIVGGKAETVEYKPKSRKGGTRWVPPRLRSNS